MSYTREVVELDDDEKSIDYAKLARSCLVSIRYSIKNKNPQGAKKGASMATSWARMAMMHNYIGSNISIEDMIKQANQK